MDNDQTISNEPDNDRTVPLDSSHSTPPGDLIGTNIGPYHLLRPIGMGGMGEVFEAEQTEPIRRRVALKVIKQGMDTRAVVARFDAERQALAMMDHPCIAKVYDAGATEYGRPFFAMEYIEGAPITDYCNSHRLDNRQRLELFVRVCEGVQHAHQKAIIHRDLKPSNILVTEVDGLPLPKIIDFGVAKATTQRLTEMTMFTELGQMLGTPEYMSPEQASMTEADIDTRTDVYALGVVLYKLLSGVLPFESKELRKAGYEAIRKIICQQEPPRPSTRFSTLGELSTDVAKAHGTAPKRLKNELRGDLDWITMKALEKDRERRYETVNGLAADVRRHLENQPVNAGPPTMSYRMTKFIRRHRPGVAIATVSLIALVAFAVTSTLQAKAIAHQRDRAEAEAGKSKAMNEFLATTLASADPWNGGGRDATVVQALDAAVKQMDTAFKGQPDVEASMRAVLGQTYLGLGKLEPATDQIEYAKKLLVEKAGPDQYELGRLLVVEAKLRHDSAQLNGAIESATAATEIFRNNSNASTYDLMNAYQVLTRNLIAGQRYAEAESVLTLSKAMAPMLEGDQRTLIAVDFSQHADLIYERDGAAVEADSLSRLAYEKALAVDPSNPSAPTYMNNAAQYRSHGGDNEGALADFDVALALYEKHFGTDHPEYATCLENRGGILYRLGRAEETFAALEKVHDIRSRNLGPSHINVVRTGLNMGTVASITGDYEGALSIFRDLKPILIEARGMDHPDVLTVLRNEGDALKALKRMDEAKLVYKQALDISMGMYEDDHQRTAQAHIDYGIALVQSGQVTAAEPHLLAAFRVFLELSGPEHPTTCNAAEWIVELYRLTGEDEKADPYREYCQE